MVRYPDLSQLNSVNVGDRIAQLILEEIRMAPAVEVDVSPRIVLG